MSRIMNVFYGTDGLPYKDKECSVHFPIVGQAFAGASLVDGIKFYVDNIGGTNDITWVVVAKRADGTKAYEQLSANEDDDGNYVYLSLSSYYTERKGDLYLSLNGYNGGVDISVNSDTVIYEVSGTPIVQVTGSIKLTIAYATQMDQNVGEVPVISVQEALATVTQKLDKSSGIYFKVVDNISNINTTTYQSFIFSGDVVYCKTNKTFYSISGTYPSLSATEIVFNLDTLNVGDLNVEDELFVPTFHNVIDENEQSLNTFTFETALEVAQGYSYSKSETDDLLTTLKANAFQVVQTLPVTGQQGIIYLVPISGQDGYTQYIWENGSYINLGTTAIELDDFYTKAECDDLLDLKANKTGPLPYYGLSSTDNVVDFITSHNLTSDEPVVLNIDGNLYVGYLYKSASNLTFSLQEFGGYGVYYGTISGSGWEQTQFISLFDTIYTFELVNNKVSSFSDIPTNTKYPSEKLVYDSLQNLREVAEGKCKTICISYNMNFTEVKDYLIAIVQTSGEVFLYNNATGEFDNDITLAVSLGEYDNYDALNGYFNDQSAEIGIGSYLSDYLIFNEDGVIKVIVGQHIQDFLHKGDIILVYETDVPDRWYDLDSFYKLETSKVDLTNYYTKNASLVPSSNNTYDLGSSSYTFKDLHLHHYIEFNLGETFGTRTIGIKNYNLWFDSINSIFTGSIIPDVGSTGTLGNSQYKWGAYITTLTDTGSRSVDGLCGKTGTPTVSSNSVELPYDTISTLSLSANTSITLQTNPTGCTPEYRAKITNSGSGAINLTFASGTLIKTNDEDNVLISSNVAQLTSGTSVELSIVDGCAVIVNFGA